MFPRSYSVTFVNRSSLLRVIWPLFASISASLSVRFRLSNSYITHGQNETKYKFHSVNRNVTLIIKMVNVSLNEWTTAWNLVQAYDMECDYTSTNEKKTVLDLFYFPYSYNCMMIRKASLVVQCMAYVIIEMMAMLRIRWLCGFFGRSFWLQMTTAEWNEMCAKLDENVSASLYKTKMYPMNDKRKNQ